MVGLSIGVGCSTCCEGCSSTPGLPNSAPSGTRITRYEDTFSSSPLNPTWLERFGASYRVLPDPNSYATLPQNDGNAPKAFDIKNGTCVCELDPTIGKYVDTPVPGGLYDYRTGWMLGWTYAYRDIYGIMARKRLYASLDKNTVAGPTVLTTFVFKNFKLPTSGPWFGPLAGLYNFYYPYNTHTDRWAPIFVSGWPDKTRSNYAGNYYDPSWEGYNFTTKRHVGIRINYGHKNSDAHPERSHSYFSCLPNAYYTGIVTPEPIFRRGSVYDWNGQYTDEYGSTNANWVHYRSPNTNWHACRTAFLYPQFWNSWYRFTLKEDEGLRTEQVNNKRITYAHAVLKQNFWPTGPVPLERIFRYYLVGETSSPSHLFITSTPLVPGYGQIPPEIHCWITMAHDFGYGFYDKWFYDTSRTVVGTGVPETYSLAYDDYLFKAGSIRDREMQTYLPNLPPVITQPSLQETGLLTSTVKVGQYYPPGSALYYPGIPTQGYNSIKAYDWDGYIANCVVQNLPPGLQLDFATGTLYGTPTTAGTYPLVITVYDDRGATDVSNGVWTIVVNP